MARETVIVGGGAAGALLAVQLASRLPQSDRLLVIEPAAELGRGAAYSTRLSQHLLNVPAASMSAFESEPAHFVEWAWRSKAEARELAQDLAGLKSKFLPRSWYGEYLVELVAERCQKRLGARFTHLRETAIGVQKDSRWKLKLGSGGEAGADQLVLALGNFRPAVPEGIPPAAVQSSAWIGNAWNFDALRSIPRDEPVAILGTGLTMVDVVVALRTFGHVGKITAISRKGLLPFPHASSAMAFTGAESFLAETTALGLFRRFRGAVEEHRSRGGAWQDIFAAFRGISTKSWESLPAAERARFLRHLKSYWEVHRHRVPAHHLDGLQSQIRKGTLEVLAARIRGAALAPSLANGVVELRLARRGGGELTIQVKHLINATGPINDFRRSSEPIVASLRDQGFASPHPTGFGFEVDEKLGVLGKSGPTPALFALGSVTKGRFWETTAVPDIRRQAEALARTLIA